MSRKQIIALLFTVCFVLSSCSKKTVIPVENEYSSVSNDISVTSEKLPYYTAEKIEINDGIVVGICNGEILCYSGKWNYSIGYSDCRNTNERYAMPSDLKGVSVLKEKNEKVYCYGFDGEDNYKISVFSSDMSETHEINDEAGTVYCISPDKYGNVITCSMVDGEVCFQKFSENADLLEIKKYDASFFDGEDYIFPQDIVVSDGGNLFFHYDNNDGCHISVFNDSFEFVTELPNEYKLDMVFSENENKIYVCDSHFEDNVYNFYCIDESEMVLDYAGTLTGVDSVFAGAGVYDYFYYINEDFYGYRIEEDSSVKITSDMLAEHLFSNNNDLKMVISDDIYYEEVFGIDKDGSKRLIFGLNDSEYTDYEKLCYPDHFQVVQICDDVCIYDVDTRNGDSEQINLDIDDNRLINNILINSSYELVYYYDENTGNTGMSVYDRNGNEIVQFSSADELVDSAVLNTSDYFLLSYDCDKETAYPSVLNTTDNQITPVSFEGIGDEEYVSRCFASSEENTVFAMTETNIYKGKVENEKCVLRKVVDLQNISNMNANIIQDFYAADNNLYMKTENGLYMLRSSESPEKIGKTEIKVMCINSTPDDTITDIFEYKYPDLKLNYVIFNEEEGDINDQINLQLISDDAPDVIMTYEDEINNYNISRDNSKDAYIDLYEFIDSDSEINRGDFQENILSALEYENHLYQITPFFSLKTILSDSDKCPYQEGWSISEFTEFLQSHSSSAFYRNDFDTVSKTALNLMPFYDYEKSKAYFNTDEFKNLMETIKIFPETSEKIEDFILYSTELTGFDDENYIRNCYFSGKSISNIGYPGISGNGVIIVPDVQFSVIKNSSHAEEVWNFIKLYFSEDYFNSNNNSKFPVSKNMMKKYADRILNADDYNNSDISLIGYDINKNPVNLNPTSTDSVEFIQNIIDNASDIYMFDHSIENIFYENYFEYIDGSMGIDVFAEKTQKKADIYLSERY